MEETTFNPSEISNAPLNSADADDSPLARPSQGAAGIDLDWVWREVRKRVFLRGKLTFSLAVADALKIAVPIAFDDNIFVVGFASRDYPMAAALSGATVKNTIEGILRQAAGHNIILEVIEGTTMADWEEIHERRVRAQSAMIAMAERKVGEHHFDDVLNQIVGEIRHRVSQVQSRSLPQVRAELVLDIAPSLADAEEMLFGDQASHEAQRAMARVIDRIATFLDVPPLTLALEIERHRRANRRK